MVLVNCNGMYGSSGIWVIRSDIQSMCKCVPWSCRYSSQPETALFYLCTNLQQIFVQRKPFTDDSSGLFHFRSNVKCITAPFSIYTRVREGLLSLSL